MDYPPLGLYYDDSGYREITRALAGAPAAGQPAGLMGRQVAGKAFLDAYLSFGSWDEVVAVVPNPQSLASLKATCAAHPSSRERQRRLTWVQMAEFHQRFSDDPPTRNINFPCPPDPRFAWTRQFLDRHQYALSGVTHTLCSTRALEVLCQLVTVPFEHYGRLICTSEAVVRMVQQVTSNYCDYLRERFGGNPALRVPLAKVPLGVDTR